MKVRLALARSLACEAPHFRQALVRETAKQMAAGNTEAVDELGQYLDQRAYGKAYVRAAELRRKPVEQAVARIVARCFVVLRDVTSRLRLSGGGRR